MIGTTGTTKDSSSATLSVESNTPGVKVYIDSMMVGTTPLNNFTITPDKHVLMFVYSDGKLWLVPAIIETLSITAGEHVRREANFPKVYHLTSDPYGAEVYLNDSLVGQTPLMLATQLERGIIMLKMEGYESVEFPLATEGGMLHSALVSKTGMTASALVNGEQVKSMTPVYVSSGAAIVGGTLAAYFKIKADGYYNDYRNTGDQAALDRVRRFDTISGVALVTSEISLLMLSYFLLSR
jgi:hypothetical protein